MKTRLLALAILGGLSLTVIVLVGLNRAGRVDAGLPPLTADSPEAVTAAIDDLVEYVVVLAVPAPDSLQVPASWVARRVDEWARTATLEQARPLIARLDAMRARGAVASFEVRSDLHAVVVRAPAVTDLIRALRDLPDIAFVAPADGDAMVCAADAAQALVEQVRGQAAAQGRREAVAAQAGAAGAPVATILVYSPPGGGFTYIGVQTVASATVEMRLYRKGALIVEEEDRSDHGGYAVFFPWYQSCSAVPYTWAALAGDRVEVIVGGETVTMTVAGLSASVDPVADVVSGRTEAARQVQVVVEDVGVLCSARLFTATVASDAAGFFTARFAPSSFDRSALATVSILDAAGHSTFGWFDAHHIEAWFGTGQVVGAIAPSAEFIATLGRAGVTSATIAGKASPTGSYSAVFTRTVQPGDNIRVVGGGVTMTYTATYLTLIMDPATDRVTGTTGSGRRVLADFWSDPLSEDFDTRCGDGSTACAGATADAAGNFSLAAGLDLWKGDAAFFYVLDGEGNWQSTSDRHMPILVADLDDQMVWGYWSSTGLNLRALLKTGSGTLKSTVPVVVPGPTNGHFMFAFPIEIAPGDRIEVGDGRVTETMRVSNLTARLDGTSGHLTGVASAGRIVAGLTGFTCNDYHSLCGETPTSDGPYDLAFPGPPLAGQDEVVVYNLGMDGHATSRRAHAFLVAAEQLGSTVWGHTETPDTVVTITLKAGVTTKATITVTSDAWGDFEVELGGQVTINPGDTLWVRTADGEDLVLTIATFSILRDPVNNALYGIAPAGSGVMPYTGLRAGQYSRYYWGVGTTADATGHYTSSFEGRFWYLDCSAVNVGAACSWVEGRYCAPGGHEIWLAGEEPSPASPDMYEADNSSATAKAYAGPQTHTFHVGTDQDWVKFTVPDSAVAKHMPYRIETYGLGFGMDTMLFLYSPNGTTLLASDDDSGARYASLIRWRPTAAATYFVKIVPAYSGYGGYCDAVYRLRISPVGYTLYLPIVMRGPE